MVDQLPVVLVASDDAAVAVEVIASLAGNVILDATPPAEPWDQRAQRNVQRLHVDTTDLTSQAEAVRLAARGVGLVVVIDDAARVARFTDALRRSAGVHDWRRRPITALGEEHLRLLHAIASGATASVAATSANVSLRTAHRRVGEARAAFGVPTTARAAVLVANACAAWVPRPVARWAEDGARPLVMVPCPESRSPWATGRGPELSPSGYASWELTTLRRSASHACRNLLATRAGVA